MGWSELPDTVRKAVESQLGAVAGFEPATAGGHSRLSGTLTLVDGTTVFCKGTSDDDPNLWMHRHEALVNPHLPASIAPRMLFQVEQDGWLLLVFERADGEHADLTPGSADLRLVAKVVGSLGWALTPCPVEVRRSLAQHWDRLSPWKQLAECPQRLDPADAAALPAFLEWEQLAVAAVDGDCLSHTDLHSMNILVSQDEASVIDWAWARRATSWVDPAFLVLRLIDKGNSVEQAEEWAASLPQWRKASVGDLAAFAVEVLGTWEYLRITAPLPHRERLSKAAREWATHRLNLA